MHTFSNGFAHSSLCSGQPFAVTASYHSCHILPLFVLGLVCFLMPAQINRRTCKYMQRRQINVDYKHWIASLSISCLVQLWFVTFSKPQVFFSSDWREKTGNIFSKHDLFSSTFFPVCISSLSCDLFRVEIFSWGSWKVIVAAHKVCATFQPQSWCAVYCVWAHKVDGGMHRLSIWLVFMDCQQSYWIILSH